MNRWVGFISRSWRRLSHRPLEAAFAVVAVGLGVGLATSVFCVLRGTVLHQLAFPAAERLMRVESRIDGEEAAASTGDFLAWRSGQRTFDVLHAWTGASALVGFPGAGTERFNGAYISPGMFRHLAVQPLLGRDFVEAEGKDNAPLAVLLGAGIWRSHLHADPKAVGKVLTVNGEPAMVVGVMPDGFGFPLRQEIWLPLRLREAAAASGDGPKLQVLGVLARGTSATQAAEELKVLLPADPKRKRDLQIRVKPYIEAYTEDQRPAFQALYAASVGLLLVVASSLASLFAGAASRRGPELAMRSALGASRARLLLEILAETTVLALFGALWSVPVALAGNRLYLASQGGELQSYWMNVSLTPGAVGFAVFASVGICAGSASIAAFRASGPRLGGALFEGQSPSVASTLAGRVRAAMQLALAIALLVPAAWAFESAKNLGQFDFGAKGSEVLTAQLQLPYVRFSEAAAAAFFRLRLAGALSARLPGATVAFASVLPGNFGDAAEVEVQGVPESARGKMPPSPYLLISSSYFRVLGGSPLAGRDFDARDDASGPPVAIVNRSFVRRYFGARDPIGAKLRFNPTSPGAKWRTIVGVVPDLVMGQVPPQVREGVYVPLEQASTTWFGILVRTPKRVTGNDELVLKQALASVDREVPAFWASPLDRVQANTQLPVRSLGKALVAFAGAAFLLALLGIYGVTTQGVLGQARATAIRLALGASRESLLGRVLAAEGVWILAGTLAGLLGAVAGFRLLGAFLFGVERSDPWVLVGTAALAIMFGLLACLIPATAISRTEPARVLRGD